jgi:hypothetical protein
MLDKHFIFVVNLVILLISVYDLCCAHCIGSDYSLLLK